jgi:GNAT superfamily N-acetyltransferase
MEIFELKEVTPEVIAAFAHLTPQLSSSAAIPGQKELQAMADSDASIVLLARDPHTRQIEGTLTLVVFRIPTGIRAWIEDVVVDTAARGKGIGELLTRAALDRARQEGARTVDLTSRPSREAANRLYQRVGFERRETNIYRYNL